MGKDSTALALGGGAERIYYLALELLSRCGMIRRSEKRSLIGPKAMGIRTLIRIPCSPAVADALPQPFVHVASTKNTAHDRKTMLPLVNPF